MACTILAAFLDDCWEPQEAAALLDRLAKGAAGTRGCLRVSADGARLVDEGSDELPGTASYLWVLWSGTPPTLGDLLARHEEHVRAMERGGAGGGP